VRDLRLITSRAKATDLVEKLLTQSEMPVIGIDCEGVRLGRFGRLSLMQISLSSTEVALVDARVDGVIQAISPILRSEKVGKIFHDCREDSAALFHQYDGIRLRNVFDTQIANLLHQRIEKKKPLHQIGYTDLVKDRLDVNDSEGVDMKQRMIEDVNLWHRRPLTTELVDYAIHGVKYLVPLYQSYLKGSVGIDEIVKTSQDWVDYCDLNSSISTPGEVEKIGFPLLGMVASITDKGVFFKLNIGRTGVCSTPSAMKRMLRGGGNYPPVQVGDTVELAVSGLSLDAKTVYVDRRDGDWEYFDFFRRPSPKKKDTAAQEYRHVPSLVENEMNVDPLLRRGLGEDGAIDSDDEGDIDHEPILTHKPSRSSNSL